MSNNQDIIEIHDSDDEMQESQASSSRLENTASFSKPASYPTTRSGHKKRHKRANILGVNNNLRIKKDKGKRATGIHRSYISNNGRGNTKRSLPKHYTMIKCAKAREQRRVAAGLPPSRLYFPTEKDSESDHREFYVKQMEAKKIDSDAINGYIERVEERHVIELDDLDPELLTGRPLTDTERAWVKRKQARRAGPPSSSFPSNIRPHDQHTEYIRLTAKARNIYDVNANSCAECGSMLWGTAILFPLSQPADSYPPESVVDRTKPLCVGCSRLFSCVRSKSEKMEMIYWIVKGNTTKPPPMPHSESIRRLCNNRAANMKNRAHEHFSILPDDFVTADQLFNDVMADNMHCYMVGSPMTTTSGLFNSLTFDHIKPISTSMNQPQCWSVSNLQPMARCINVTKGNESNKEIKRYVLGFIHHYNEHQL